MNKQFTAALAVFGLAATAAVYNMSADEVNMFLQSSSKYSMISAEEHEFRAFTVKYGKNYQTKEEYAARQAIFAETMASIAEHNSQNGATSSMGINKFADYTAEEKKKLTGYLGGEKQFDSSNAGTFPEDNLATEIDWRTLGAVTDVKDQGACGSCWAFSTTGSMEGAHFLATGDLVPLSESNLVDCSWTNLGCNGGLTDRAFKYAESHPLETEVDYPYHATSSLFGCSYSSKKGLVKVASYTDVTKDSSSQLKAALNVGPVSVAIQADQDVFHYYTGGIISGTECGTQLDHAVLAVGYGVENGVEYYTVKNSWTTAWGEDGYVRMAIEDGAGVCGIQMEASIPTTD